MAATTGVLQTHVYHTQVPLYFCCRHQLRIERRRGVVNSPVSCSGGSGSESEFCGFLKLL